MLEKLDGWKTRLFAILVAILGAAGVLGFVDPAAAIGAEDSAGQVWAGIVMAIAGGIAFFRQITTKPVGSG
jgi:hypothetical protein